MDRSQKEKAVEDFKKIFEGSEAIIVTQYKGLNSETIDDLRAKTRDSNVSFKVTKNRLIKIALSGGVYENISDLFSGPTAIAYSKDVVAAAKVTNEFSKNKNVFNCTTIEEACFDADLIIIHTEWNDFKSLNYKKLSKKKNFIIYDMRNILPYDKIKKDKIKYFGIGK